jgi:hypothetical protein
MRIFQIILTTATLVILALWTVYMLTRLGAVSSLPNNGALVYGAMQMWSAIATPLCLFALIAKP